MGPALLRTAVGIGHPGGLHAVCVSIGAQQRLPAVVLRPATVDVRELRGLLHRKGLTPLSVEEMNAVIRRRGAGRA